MRPTSADFFPLWSKRTPLALPCMCQKRKFLKQLQRTFPFLVQNPTFASFKSKTLDSLLSLPLEMALRSTLTPLSLISVLPETVNDSQLKTVRMITSRGIGYVKYLMRGCGWEEGGGSGSQPLVKPIWLNIKP